MKKNRIIELLGETQVQFIEEAAPKPENRVKRLKWVVFAACICMIAIGAVMLSGRLLSPRIEDQVGAPGDIVPLIYVEDTLYRVSQSQKMYDEEVARDFEYLGKIKSQVGRNEVPTEEFSSNEAIIVSRVYRYNDELVVEINGLYCVYVVLKE